MRHFRRHARAGACALLLVSCAASPPLNYYRLTAIELEPGEPHEDPVVVGLGPLRFPEYLRQSQIVQRGPGARMRIDDLNRWVEPLDEAASRVLTVNIDNLLHNAVVVAFPAYGPLEADYRVTGSVSRFEADETGRVELVVQWSIGRPGEGVVVVAPRTRRYTATAAHPEQPAAVAEAMSDALAQLGRDIAQTLERVM